MFSTENSHTCEQRRRQRHKLHLQGGNENIIRNGQGSLKEFAYLVHTEGTIAG